MPKTDELSELAYIDPKDFFENEPKVFTPWVSTDGLGLLSDSLKMQLDLVGTEQSVGALKADIVCEDPDYGTVVIENQLTLSDNKHIGQLIAYAAGTRSSTVVWIAPRIRPEHRVSIGWLNELGSPKVRFFGVEIELWRIAGSATAPRFVVVAHPDDWETPKPEPGPTVETRASFLIGYWMALRDHLDRLKIPVALFAPLPQAFNDAPIGKAACTLRSSISVQKKQTKVALVITGDVAKAYGHLLHFQKDEIEREFGDEVALDWKLPPDLKSTVISTVRTGWNLEDQAEWTSQFEWFANQLGDFEKVFGPRVRALNASDYTPEKSDEEPDEPEGGSQEAPPNDEDE